MELSPRLATALRKAEAKIGAGSSPLRRKGKAGRKGGFSLRAASKPTQKLIRTSKRPNTAPGPVHDLQESIKRNPNSFPILRSKTPRFSDKPTGKGADAPPMHYQTDAIGPGMTISAKVARSPRHISVMRSKAKRFTEQKSDTPDVVYDLEKGKTASMAATVLASARTYTAIRSKTPRFGARAASAGMPVPSGAGGGAGMEHIGPGSYGFAPEKPDTKRPMSARISAAPRFSSVGQRPTTAGAQCTETAHLEPYNLERTDMATMATRTARSARNASIMRSQVPRFGRIAGHSKDPQLQVALENIAHEDAAADQGPVPRLTTAVARSRRAYSAAFRSRQSRGDPHGGPAGGGGSGARAWRERLAYLDFVVPDTTFVTGAKSSVLTSVRSSPTKYSSMRSKVPKHGGGRHDPEAVKLREGRRRGPGSYDLERGEQATRKSTTFKSLPTEERFKNPTWARNDVTWALGTHVDPNREGAKHLARKTTYLSRTQRPPLMPPSESAGVPFYNTNTGDKADMAKKVGLSAVRYSMMSSKQKRALDPEAYLAGDARAASAPRRPARSAAAPDFYDVKRLHSGQPASITSKLQEGPPIGTRLAGGADGRGRRLLLDREKRSARREEAVLHSPVHSHEAWAGPSPSSSRGGGAESARGSRRGGVARGADSSSWLRKSKNNRPLSARVRRTAKSPGGAAGRRSGRTPSPRTTAGSSRGRPFYTSASSERGGGVSVGGLPGALPSPRGEGNPGSALGSPSRATRALASATQRFAPLPTDQDAETRQSLLSIPVRSERFHTIESSVQETARSYTVFRAKGRDAPVRGRGFERVGS